MRKRTVLVTGITGGIGSYIAILFAEKGWNIIGQYCSSKEKVGTLVKSIEKYDINLKLLRADFTQNTNIKALLSKLTMPIDSLINNSGSYYVMKHFSELTIQELNYTFMINTFVPILLTSKIFLKMKKNGFGRIVNISSIASKYGGSNHSMHYGCSKRALEGITKTLSREGAEHNVLVNTVRPGVIDTEAHEKFKKDMEARISLIPMKQKGSPKDIAKMVYYLGSEENDFITNEIVTISGGE
jgi:NAD(P)-dependent dehydrogenase (short-subunit alcohol dehydrogenase family)